MTPGEGAPSDGLGAPGRYPTPTGAPCPRAVRSDGSVIATAAGCHGCGYCLLLEAAGWAGVPPVVTFDPRTGDLRDARPGPGAVETGG